MDGRCYRATQGAAVAAMLGLLACSSPTDPGKKPGAPVITCPANITVRGVPGGTQPVTFTPTVSGGTLPITTSCTPASGSSFSVGTAPVSCIAVDASSRLTQCSFTVTLTPLVLSVTKFVAFGDSVTIGENGRISFRGERVVDTLNAYPTKLQALLNVEYPGQGIGVINYGQGGERVEDGLERLTNQVLPRERPNVLLLLEGYNNLLNTCAFGSKITTACNQKISDVISGLREMVRMAKRAEYGVRYIFVSTLTPPGPYLGGGTDRRIGTDAIVATNAGISTMARSEGATLVDTYPTFIGHEPDYVDQDGLHLRPAGYQALAESFFNAIKMTVTSTPALRETSH